MSPRQQVDKTNKQAQLSSAQHDTAEAAAGSYCRCCRVPKPSHLSNVSERCFCVFPQQENKLVRSTTAAEVAARQQWCTTIMMLQTASLNL